MGREPLHLGDTVHLSIDGMGIVLFSTEVMRYVVPGSDFLTEEFTNPKQVGEQIRKGDITAFCAGTGGDFILWFRPGCPDSNAEKEFPVMIRLAVEVRGGKKNWICCQRMNLTEIIRYISMEHAA